VKEVATALERDDGAVAAALARGESASVRTPSGEVELSAADVELTQETIGGWGVAAEGGLTVALDLEVTPDLALEGIARELVRMVQDARRAAGLQVSDRIELAVKAAGRIAEAVRAHRTWIAGETLAVDIREGALENPTREERGEMDGAPVEIGLRKA
jgi:isoleucyl-tRNA synthetase